MKWILTILTFIIIICTSTNAGKWNDPIYLESTSHPFLGFLMNTDSLQNTWFCITPYLWMTDSLGNTVKKVDTIKRENEELIYRYDPTDNILQKSICFSASSFFSSKQDTLIYVTKDSIFKIDTTNPVIQEIGLPRMYPMSITYFDSAYYFFLTNKPYYPDKPKQPGMFRYCERTRQLEWITKTTNFDEVPHFNSLDIYNMDSLIFYPSFNNGLVFYNSKSKEVIIKDLRKITGNNNLNPRNHHYKDGILYFMSDIATLYKLNLRTMEYTTEDLSDTPICHDNDTVTNFQVALMYACNDYKLYSYYISKNATMSKYDLYIHYSNGKWATKHIYAETQQNVDNLSAVSSPRVSPDTKRWWVYGLLETPYVDSNGKEYLKFVRSYDMDPGSSIEETEAMPTALLTKVYPNPSNRTISIEFFLHPNFREDVTFEIYDYMGRKIKDLDNSYDYSAVEAWGKKTINVESMSTGIYYLVLDNGNEKRSIGFAVE